MVDKRINEAIRVPEVRLIAPDGEQVGVVPLDQALERAADEALDLVEISPTAKPPVCKIMDYGKFRFEEEKRLKEAKKRQKVIHLKEVKFRPKIDDHDFDFKVKNALRFLERGDKVKITVRFRGREMAHTELGFAVVDRVKQFLEEHIGYNEEKPAQMEGRNITMVLAPSKKARKPAKKQESDKEKETAAE